MANDLFVVFDLARIEELSAGRVAEAYTLSPETVELCLSLLTRHVEHKFCWRYDNGPVSDAQWDEIQAIVDRAKWELIL